MRATRPGRQGDHRSSARPSAEPGRLLIRLVTQLVVAQAIAAAAIGLPFSKRQLSSILITLAMVAALCGLAFLVRSGTKTAWLVAVGFEVAFIGFGLSRFFGARYVGGTLFAIIAFGTLLHPAVARAYTVLPPHGPQEPPDEVGLGAAAGGYLRRQDRGLGPVVARSEASQVRLGIARMCPGRAWRRPVPRAAAARA